ncbi:MAG TPA: hypothetical protein VF173_30105 [Thermoanaerobaculia bacterium]|nr:hypothetical protein [Thermoanaerobaculia bacterium]
MRLWTTLLCFVVLYGPALPVFGQEAAGEQEVTARIKSLDEERNRLNERLQAIEAELRTLRAKRSPAEQGPKLEIEGDIAEEEVLQAPYDYATSVIVQGKPWVLAPGKRLTVVGGVSSVIDGYWRVREGDRTGYVKDTLLKLYYDGAEVSILDRKDVLKSLALKTRDELAAALQGKRLVVFGVFPDGPNSAGGSGAKIVYRYLDTRKIVKYLYFTVTPFNSVGDQVIDRISHRSQAYGDRTSGSRTSRQERVSRGIFLGYDLVQQCALLPAARQDRHPIHGRK